jgi:hypothetical protein
MNSQKDKRLPITASATSQSQKVLTIAETAKTLYDRIVAELLKRQ